MGHIRTLDAIMRISIVSVIFLLILGCSGNYPEHPNYQLIVEQSGYYSGTGEPGNIHEEFGLTFKLTSNYDTLPAIYLMTCSWPEHTIIDNEKIRLGTGCDANYMSRVKLKTDQYLELQTVARPSRFFEGYDLTKSKFRVALIAIDTTEMDFGFYLFNSEAEKFLDSLKSQQERYIWSNEIQLKRLNSSERMPFGSWELIKASNIR